jgi:ABC-2 type transport system permease protein/lipopolysaccharide transport system permease protein
VWVRRLLDLNPAAPIVRCFQISIYEGRFPDAATAGLAFLFAVVSLTGGFWMFVRVQDRHIHYF